MHDLCGLEAVVLLIAILLGLTLQAKRPPTGNPAPGEDAPAQRAAAAPAAITMPR